MSILDVITLLGGLAFFMFGMDVMSGGLEKLAGGKLESSLKKMTSNRFKAILLGAGITIAVQSSSAVTVMLVGLVNSGIMQLGQTIGVIMGSNIGTTLTAWILSLSGIDGKNIFMQLLKPECFSLVLALIGTIFTMFSKSDKKKNLATIFIGFAVLIYGMELMGGSTEALADDPNFGNVLTNFLTNPLLGVLAGAVITGIIQSSAASVGILMTLAAGLATTGNPITFGMAIPIIMGQNIGTCVTALISSIGVNKNARRVAVVHISFNIIGTVVCLSLYMLGDLLFKFPFSDMAVDGFGISLVHSVFNIVTTVMLIPFTKLLEKLAYIVIKDKGTAKEEFTFIDDRLLNTPSFALKECVSKTKEMALVAKDSIFSAIKLMVDYNDEVCQAVFNDEDKLDMYEDNLGTYLVKLSKSDLSDKDSREISKLLHTIGDFERLGDHALNLLKAAEEIHEKNIQFSENATKELAVLKSAIVDIMEVTITAFDTNDIQLAKTVEPLEQVIDDLTATIKNNHIQRLQNGSCTIELGFVLNDLLTNYERVSDHCSNIAVAMIEVEQNEFDTHKYLNDIKSSENAEYNSKYKEYTQKYSINS